MDIDEVLHLKKKKNPHEYVNNKKENHVNSQKHLI